MTDWLHPDSETLARFSLEALGDGRLNRLVEEHLEICSACRDDLSCLDGTGHSVASFDEGSVAGRAAGRNRTPWIVAVAAGLVALVGLGVSQVAQVPPVEQEHEVASQLADVDAPFARSGFEDGLGSWSISE